MSARCEGDFNYELKITNYEWKNAPQGRRVTAQRNALGKKLSINYAPYKGNAKISTALTGRIFRQR
ncbi:MAG: hypothetical protein LBP75_11800 [Planctomycetota bacterium]|jgi:hypothetical protein|nr:hypothetical protein [Planctomycetota bacterium]